jgi:hypothetical protein
MKGFTTRGVPEVKTEADKAGNIVADDAKWGRKYETTMGVKMGDECEIDVGSVEGADSKLNEAQGAEIKLREAAKAAEQRGEVTEVQGNLLMNFSR